MRTHTKAKLAIGVASFSIWSLMAWFDPTLRADYLHFIELLATGTLGLTVRDMAQPAPPTPPKDPS